MFKPVSERLKQLRVASKRYMLGAKRYRYILLEHHSYSLLLLRETIELETGTCFRQKFETTIKLGIFFD